MATLQFQKATKRRAKARVAIDGPSGAGKTYTALIAATVLAEGGKIAVIDTERGSASLYSDEFSFDVLELNDFNPRNYVEAIEAAEAAKYAVIVIDSLSHAWEGEGGALDMVDQAAKRSKSGNNFTAWRDITPLHRRLVDAILQANAHVIATMRSKTEYVLETVERNGRTVQQPKKVGMAPIQRQGMEYEFTIVADMDVDHNLAITKSRCKPLADKVEGKPGPKFWKVFLDWLNSGDAAAPPPARAKAQAAPVEARDYTEDEIGPDFDSPDSSTGDLAPAAPKSNSQQAAEQGAAANRPTKAMREKFDALAAEARALGVADYAVPDNVTAGELAKIGTEIRAQVAKAQAAKAAAPAPGNSKKPTREQLEARVRQLAKEAIELSLIGPAWVPSPKWTEADWIKAGQGLRAKLDAAKAEAEHAHA